MSKRNITIYNSIIRFYLIDRENYWKPCCTRPQKHFVHCSRALTIISNCVWQNAERVLRACNMKTPIWNQTNTVTQLLIKYPDRVELALNRINWPWLGHILFIICTVHLLLLFKLRVKCNQIVNYFFILYYWLCKCIVGHL